MVYEEPSIEKVYSLKREKLEMSLTLKLITVIKNLGKIAFQGLQLLSLRLESSLQCLVLKALLGILNIEKIDVLPCEKNGLGQFHEYEVLQWGNQNDIVKCRMLNTLLSGLSNAYMNEIPREDEYWIEGEATKKKLEKVFLLELNSDNNNLDMKNISKEKDLEEEGNE